MLPSSQFHPSMCQRQSLRFHLHQRLRPLSRLQPHRLCLRAPQAALQWRMPLELPQLRYSLKKGYDVLRIWSHSLWNDRFEGLRVCEHQDKSRELCVPFHLITRRITLFIGGGCSILLDTYSPRGRDCSAIPGVSGVSCDNAACIVHECMPGYAISYDRNTCYDEDQFSLAKEVVQNYRIASGFI